MMPSDGGWLLVEEAEDGALLMAAAADGAVVDDAVAVAALVEDGKATATAGDAPVVVDGSTGRRPAVGGAFSTSIAVAILSLLLLLVLGPVQLFSCSSASSNE